MKRLLTSAVVVLVVVGGRAQAGGGRFGSGPSVPHAGSVGGQVVSNHARPNAISLPPGGGTLGKPVGTTIGKPVSSGLPAGNSLPILNPKGSTTVKTLPANLGTGLPGKINGGPGNNHVVSPGSKNLHSLTANAFAGKLGDKGPPLVKPGVKGVLPIAKGPGVAAVKNYHMTHGTKFNQGYCYKGQHHNHWSYCCWHPKYNCCCWWDPCLLSWYYWCEPHCCYYPITYVTVVAPTPVVIEMVPVVIQTVVTETVVTEVGPAAAVPTPPAPAADVPPPPPYPVE